jgi:hypothetical protein
MPPPPGFGAPPTVNKRPEWVWPLLISVVVAAELVLTASGTFARNVAAAVLGLLVSVVLLGISRARETRLRADGRFTDWGIISAGSFMSIATIVGWAIGVANVYFVAKEFTR